MKFQNEKNILGSQNLFLDETQPEITEEMERKTSWEFAINHANDISPRPPAIFSTGQFDQRWLIVCWKFMQMGKPESRQLMEIQLCVLPLEFIKMIIFWNNEQACNEEIF